MRDDGEEQQRGRLEDFLGQGAAGGILEVTLVVGVEQFHDRSDGGVELLAAAVIVGDLAHGLVQLAPEVGLRGREAVVAGAGGDEAGLHVLVSRFP
ncbi:hypothetical protein SDC9_186150 [bioreactor metagenome]|uniref:Uncharacterized protein n=1 Tax=bioreactor metagenome TaxID=1076179 RepID=A0A645HJ46_9ZZZZ